MSETTDRPPEPAIDKTDRAELPACMGGWCTVRDRCAQHLTMSRRVVVERMCERGNEQPVPVRTA